MDRVYVPPKRQTRLGSRPPCDPFYQQLTLPRTAAAPGTLSAPSGDAGDNRQRFHRFASIVTPAAGSTNTLITSYKVPDGHSAEVVGLLLNYIAAVPPGNFVEGDATLLFFSLRLNGAQFVSDYATIPNDLGDLFSGPWPLPGKLNLYAADLLEVLVTVPGGSTITTGGTNRCHGHLLGWYAPSVS